MYVTPRDPSCIFCKIVLGKIPARIITQNERAVAFLDAFPLAVGHTLVVPKAHFQKIQEMATPDTLALFNLTHEITEKVESAAGAKASTIAIHNGREAGQEIPHVHVHIIPRSPSDGAGPVHSMFKSRPKLSEQDWDALLGKMTMK